MSLRSKLTATSALVLFFALAPLSTVQAAEGTTVFPPKNLKAGSGLLYFPQGGDSSLYAVPVLSDPQLIAAINNQTAAMNTDAAAIVAAIEKLQLAGSGGTGGAGGTGGSSYVPYPNTITCSSSYHYSYSAMTSNGPKFGGNLTPNLTVTNPNNENYDVSGTVIATLSYNGLSNSTYTYKGTEGYIANQQNTVEIVPMTVTYSADIGTVLNISPSSTLWGSTWTCQAL